MDLNVVLIVIDTLRADHLGCYGYSRDTSPNLDELSEKGILFENHISPAAHTTPSFTSIFTGQHPFHHGVIATLHAIRNERRMILDDNTRTLPDLLYGNGWDNVGFDNMLHMRGKPKWFALGFKYCVNLSRTTGRPAFLKANEVNEVLIPWIDRLERGNNFIFIHYWDPHQPPNQPEEFRNLYDENLDDLERIETPSGENYVMGAGKEEEIFKEDKRNINLYDGEIRYVDHKIGELISKLKGKGMYDDTCLIVTSDHGEDMKEHHAPFDHRETYEHTIRVPLIMKPPKSFGVPANKKVGVITSHSDILPTILDFANIDFVPRGPTLYGKDVSRDRLVLDLDGISLIPLIQGKRDKVRNYVVSTGCYFGDGDTYKSVEICVRGVEKKLILRSPIVPGNYSQQTETGDDTVAGLIPDYIENSGEVKHPVKIKGYHIFNSLPRKELLNFKEDPSESKNILEEDKISAEELYGYLVPYIKSPLFYSLGFGDFTSF